MKIYNSLTKTKEEFIPLQENQVSMYTCGVTVYDDCHIGHARSVYEFEVMRNYLEYKGYKVKFVRNITDIDDKILNKAVSVSDGDLQKAWQEVIDTNIKNYQDDVKALGLREPDFEPKASEYVEKIVEFIEVLVERGYAYESDGSVYFRTRKYHDDTGSYGELSGRKIDDLLSGVRKGEDTAKEESLDFVLWKAEKDNEIAWDSPWGPGRPGWHIECSVMSTDILGDTFDIHGGGLDLIFPHHENEIAQSKAKTGKDYAKYWIHHGLLSIEKQKMSKSLGNFVTIKDVLQKYPADILKVFFLQASYSSTIDFSWDRMEEAKKAYGRILALKERLDQIEATDDVAELKENFIETMDDDFNTPRALAVLFDIVSKANKLNDEEVSVIKPLFFEIIGIFGFTFEKIEKQSSVSEDEINEKIELRKQAKADKDFAKADQIRDDLASVGVILKDKPGGITEFEYA